MEPTEMVNEYKHPHAESTRALAILIIAEFWDRFNFCGILTVLVVYLKKQFFFSDTKAYATWGVFLALAYITPVFGGIIADKVLGFVRAIIVGSTLMVGGGFFLGLSHSIFLYIGLSLFLFGIGLFKGNISSLVGILDVVNNSNRHEVYSRFFMGIMSGAILGPFIFGLLIYYADTAFCFWAGALGNLSALLLLISFRKSFLTCRSVKQFEWLENLNSPYVYFAFLFFIVLISFFKYPVLSNHFLGLVSFCVTVLLAILAIRFSKQDSRKIIGLMLLGLLLVFYYAASFQVNGSLMIGIAREFNIYFLRWPIPSTSFAALEALFAFLLSPLFISLWAFLNQHFFEPPIIFKLILGLLFAGLSFLLFAWLFSEKIYPLFTLLFANCLLGASVVCIFPTHLSAVSLYAPQAAQGTIMGMSFLSDALAGYVSSLMNVAASTPHYFAKSRDSYSAAYFDIAMIMFFSCFLLILLTPFLNYLFRDLTKQVTAS